MTPDDDKTAFDPRRNTSFEPTAAVPRTELTPPPSPAPAPTRAHDMGNGLPVGTRLGEFEITSVIGEGGFGIVYLAVDHSLGRRVALKEYMPSSLAARTADSHVQVKSERHRETFEAGRKSFVNEARLLASFDHPSLVKVYRFWEANGTAYMVMPFYEGKNLRDTLRAMGHAPDETWLRTLLVPLTEALRVIHADQCYHRDIAPDNVMMLAGSQRPLLLDFGAARRVIGDMTQALTVILKPGYAPIEQYAEVPGMRQGPWTDVYALAAVVYSSITGKTPPVSVGRLMNDNYQPLAEVAAGRYSARFLAAVDRALAVRPEQRTPSIEAFCEDLGLNAPTAATAPMAPGVADPEATVIAAPRPATVAAPTRAAMPATALRAAAPVATDPLSLFEQQAGPAPAATTRLDPRTQAAGPATPAPQRRAFASEPAPAPAPAGRRGLVIGGVAVLGAAAIGGYWFSQRGKGAEGPVAQAPTPVPTPAPTAAPMPPPPAPTAAPAPAPAPTPAPPPARAPFSVAGEFQRVLQAQSAAFGVSAAAAKAQLRIGRDQFRFSVTSQRDGFLYVLGVGPDGVLARLVPNQKSGAAVRLAKGKTYRFPAGDGFSLDASDPPGASQFLVIVSAEPRAFDALAPKAEGPIQIFGAVEAAAAAHQGAGSALAGAARCAPGAACSGEYGAALLQFEAVR